MLALNKKNIIVKILILLFIIINAFTVNSLAVVNPTKDFYVNDYAGLLNSETKNYIINANKSLYNQTGAQIVVVTIQSLGNDSLEDYSTELFRSFGIGDKTKNNGVLLLLALEEREFRVEVGYGLEGILPDGKTGRIQDEYIIPYLRQDNWNDGIRNGFSAILNIVADEYSVEVGAETAVTGESLSDYEMTPFSIVGFTVMPLVSVIFGVIISTLEKMKKIKKKKKVVVSTIYMIITIGITVLIIRQLDLIGFCLMCNLIALVSGMSIYSYTRRYGRGSGPYGGGRFLWRRQIFWRRRFFWRRRKFKTLLKI